MNNWSSFSWKAFAGREFLARQVLFQPKIREGGFTVLPLILNVFIAAALRASNFEERTIKPYPLDWCVSRSSIIIASITLPNLENSAANSSSVKVFGSPPTNTLASLRLTELF